MNNRLSHSLPFLFVLLASALVLLVGASTDSTPRAGYPEEDMGVDSLSSRKKAQIDAAKQFKVFREFQLSC